MLGSWSSRAVQISLLSALEAGEDSFKRVIKSGKIGTSLESAELAR